MTLKEVLLLIVLKRRGISHHRRPHGQAPGWGQEAEGAGSEGRGWGAWPGCGFLGRTGQVG